MREALKKMQNFGFHTKGGGSQLDPSKPNPGHVDAKISWLGVVVAEFS